jgi:phage-related protein
MGFFSKVGGFFKKVGSGIGKAFGVVTAPIKEVWGVVKDSVQTIVHMPERVLKSFDKATSVVGGLGNNVERSVGSAAGAVTSVADGVAQVSDNARYISGDAKDVTQSPIVWAALGLGALLVLRS